MLSLSVAVTENGVIGRDNRLLVRLPEDMKLFRKRTMGKTLIMGRKTFESLPGMLPGRLHIVATNNRDWLSGNDQVIPVYDLKATLEKYAALPEEAVVIGGGRVYEQAMPYCDVLYITRVKAVLPGDTFFPAVDENQFELAERSASFNERTSGISYEFEIWKRKKLQLVIFDMDGLIFDSERPSLASWKLAGRQCGVELTDGFLQRIVGSSKKVMAGIFREEFEAVDFEEIYETKRRVMEEALKRDGLRTKAGLFELLDYLEAKGIRRAVATSTQRAVARAHLQSAGVLERMDGLLGGDSVERGKPDPEIYLKTLEMFDCTPENAVVLEDSKLGLLSATAAGIRCVLVPDVVTPDAESHGKAFRVVDDLFEAKTVIEGL